jgi:hypothetical protein
MQIRGIKRKKKVKKKKEKKRIQAIQKLDSMVYSKEGSRNK